MLSTDDRYELLEDTMITIMGNPVNVKHGSNPRDRQTCKAPLNPRPICTIQSLTKEPAKHMHKALGPSAAALALKD